MSEEEEEGSGTEIEPPVLGKVRRPTDALRRQLTEKELSVPAVGVMLEAEIARLDLEVEQLLPFRTRFHEVDKLRATLQTRLDALTKHESLLGVCLTLGGLLVGLAPGIFSLVAKPSFLTYVVTGCVFLVGMVLILAPVLLKAKVNGK